MLYCKAIAAYDMFAGWCNDDLVVALTSMYVLIMMPVTHS